MRVAELLNANTDPLIIRFLIRKTRGPDKCIVSPDFAPLKLQNVQSPMVKKADIVSNS